MMIATNGNIETLIEYHNTAIIDPVLKSIDGSLESCAHILSETAAHNI